MKKAVHIQIYNPIRKVKISSSRRAIYYDCLTAPGILKSKKGKIAPKKFFRNDVQTFKNLKERYTIAFIADTKTIAAPRTRLLEFSNENAFWNNLNGFILDKVTERQRKKGKWYLYDLENEEKVLANPKAAGTAKYETINYQKLYNGNYHPITRNKIVTAIKESFVNAVREHASQITDLVDSTISRLVLETFILAPTSGGWDVGNRANLYAKCMLDLITTGKIGEKIVTEPLLEDDDVKVIACEKYTHIPYEDEGLMFSLYTVSDTYLEKAKAKFLSG